MSLNTKQTNSAVNVFRNLMVGAITIATLVAAVWVLLTGLGMAVEWAAIYFKIDGLPFILGAIPDHAAGHAEIGLEFVLRAVCVLTGVLTACIVGQMVLHLFCRTR